VKSIDEEWERVKEQKKQLIWNRLKKAETAGLVTKSESSLDSVGAAESLEALVAEARAKLAVYTNRPALAQIATIGHAKSRLLTGMRRSKTRDDKAAAFQNGTDDLTRDDF